MGWGRTACLGRDAPSPAPWLSCPVGGSLAFKYFIGFNLWYVSIIFSLSFFFIMGVLCFTLSCAVSSDLDITEYDHINLSVNQSNNSSTSMEQLVSLSFWVSAVFRKSFELKFRQMHLYFPKHFFTSDISHSSWKNTTLQSRDVIPLIQGHHRVLIRLVVVVLFLIPHRRCRSRNH